MNEECLICKAPLEYLEKDVLMECAVCHKKMLSKTRCVKGHFVCNECHMRGLDAIIGICKTEESRNPVEIIERMMNQSFCHMHGPEHHVMVGAALLTAYKNAGGEIDFDSALKEKCSIEGKGCPEEFADFGVPAEQGSAAGYLSRSFPGLHRLAG